MLTDQQKDMRERFLNLIKKTEEQLDSNKDYKWADSYAVKMFLYLLDEKIKDKYRERKIFCEMTGLGKDTYLFLKGQVKEKGTVNDDTLCKVSFGMGISYEQALLLFCFYGENLLTDEKKTQKINGILLELDGLSKRLTSVERLIELDNLKDKCNVKKVKK